MLAWWGWSKSNGKAGGYNVHSRAGKTRARSLHDLGLMIALAIDGRPTLVMEAQYLGGRGKRKPSQASVLTLAYSAGQLAGPLLDVCVEGPRPRASEWRKWAGCNTGSAKGDEAAAVAWAMRRLTWPEKAPWRLAGAVAGGVAEAACIGAWGAHSGPVRT